ncbi:SDR family NAD(P)-dependent oxidoreductase [Streptomyces netropsis]
MAEIDARFYLSENAIAVVGTACRLPGGIDGPAGLWEALTEGRDLISPLPPEGRFDPRRLWDPDPERLGRSYTFAGGYLADIAGFDPAYFRISPSEAKRMDPQQRILLELTAETLDDAAIDPAALAGSDTAVFVGVSDMSYGGMQMARPEQISGHTMSGNALSLTANRVSLVFDLRGPSMAVDTACSSSLVAVHQACETLRSGRCRAALAGGVNVLVNPLAFVGFSRATMLSPKGRCASFSAGADGYVRSEGGGMVLLKRLSDALADGDRVHAVIVGSGVNSDGATAGLAAPSAEMQRRLLEEVYGRAGIDADALWYFEAHGTGTPVGDPVECEAVGRALGMRRTRGALPIGSVKSNLGHGEPASGVTGLLKSMLVLRHGRIPASLHATLVNPGIDFEGLNLTCVTEPRPVADCRPGFVGVNSFGFGGANAHVVLAPPPDRPAAARPPGGPLPLVVSARTRQALGEAAAALAERLEHAAEEEFYDLSWTATRRRGRHPHRLAVLTGTREEAARRLAADDVLDDAVEAGDEGGVVFVFSGNGSQWDGMAADLMAAEAAFREGVEEADSHLRPLLGWSVGELLARPRPAEGEPVERPMADTLYAQPALFALQAGLVTLLDSYGVRPGAVIGHSGGELTAAYVCGALDGASAARAVVERSRVQAATAGSGRMAVAALSPDEARDAIAPYDGLLEIAAVNSARDVTLSGDVSALAALGSVLTTREVAFRELPGPYAFHTAAMDGVEQQLRTALHDLKPGVPRIPMFSTVTGKQVEPAELDADYWWRNMRRTVRFAQAVRALASTGVAAAVEIGPRPTLRGALTRLAAERPRPGFTTVAAMDEGTAGPEAVRRAAARVLARAARDTDLDRLLPAPGRVTDLPAYPWQRERHWYGTPGDWSRVTSDGVFVHPLLGERLPSMEPAWYATVERTRTAWLGDHDIGGVVIMPATGYVEMALAAGRELYGGPTELDGIDIPRGLPLPWDATMDVRLQTTLSDEDGVWRVASRTGEDGSWRLHARGRARRLATPTPPPAIDPAALRARTSGTWDADRLYALLDKGELRYGPAFRLLRELHVGDDWILASYACTPPDDGYGGYLAYPPLLDAAWHACAPLLADARTMYLPATIGRVRVWGELPSIGWTHVRQRTRTRREVAFDITITDGQGSVMATMDDCRVRAMPAHAADDPAQYSTVLRAAPLPGPAPGPVPAPGPRALLAAAREEIDTLLADWSDARFAKGMEAYERVTAELFAMELRALLAGQDRFMLEDLFGVGVLPRHEQYLRMLLDLAVQRGSVVEEAGGWRILPSRTDPSPLGAELVDSADQLSFTVLCTRMLAHFLSVLRGVRDAREMLVEGADLVQQFYDLHPVNKLYNRLTRALLRQVVVAWPDDRPLRVLEVGAGTGGLTSWLLPVLPPERTHYVFTDVSSVFFPAAQARFADYDFVEYRTLDLDSDPVAQGYAPAGFDLVVADYSLHAAKDLAACLRRVASLLAEDGLLCAVEVHDPVPLALLFGPLEEFWAHEDKHLRPQSVLLPREQWPPLLRRNGFDDVVRTGAEGPPTRDQLSVLLARRTGGLPAVPRAQEPPHPPEAVSTSEDASPLSWLLITEDDAEQELHQALARRLTAAGSPGNRTLKAVEVREDEARLSEAGAGRLGIVYLLSAAQDQATADAPDAAVESAVARVATLRAVARARADGALPELRRLVLVSHPTGALPAPERPAVPGQAAVWGAARVLANELSSVSVVRVSLERGEDEDDDARRLVAELHPCDDKGEDEIVLTRAGRFVPRVVRAPRPTRPSTHVANHRLTVDRTGLGYRLAWDEAPVPRPGPGEVTVTVRAAALNYRDVMVVTGLLPSTAEEGLASEDFLCMEGAGVVTAVGPRVTDLALGDRVYGLMHSGTAHTSAPAHRLRPIPEGMTFTEAATLPIAFLTVHHSLETLARLRPGETLLVHGGAGGVGLAALQYARHIGATVIATAGTPVKRDLLRQIGAAHVLDSRDLRFADHIRELTGGRGVDVVLNSLAGEAMARSMEVLASGGRFVELGKRDVYTNSRMALRPLAHNASLHVVDLGRRLLTTTPGELPELTTVPERVREGVYRPLLHQAFPAARAREAFHLLQHSKHIGKVLLTFDEPVPVRTAPAPEPPDPEGSYLVVGGLSGLGARTALHLAERGARHLALVGRRGPDSPEAPALLRQLDALGATVSVHAVDVTDAPAMREVVQQTDTPEHPLRGIVHSALHLDDDALTDLSDDRVRAVLAPKMAGALVLSSLAPDRDVVLTLYSSLNAWVGNIHQANYAAGNLFTEALVRRRRHDGRAGLAVAWGAIGDTGYVAREGLAEVLDRNGFTPLTADDACTALDRFHAHAVDVTCYARCDWSAVPLVAPTVTGPRFSSVVPPPLPGTGYRLEELLTRLHGLPPQEAQTLLEESFTSLVAEILQMPAEQIDPARPLKEYGMDSLMALEVMAKLRRSFQYEAPVTEVLHSDGSLRGIAEIMLPKILAHQNSAETTGKSIAAGRSSSHST